jgi:amino acid adenylation domain-containing protein
MAFDSLQECFAAQVARTPDAVAVSAAGTALTYRELDDRASRLARRLADLGVAPQDPVAILLARSVELVVAIVAVAKAGAVYLPLHSAYPLARMQWIMDSAGQPVLLADRATSLRTLPTSRQVVLVDADDDDAQAGPSDAGKALVRSRPGDLAFVIHTSGSEGHPRGVALTHRGVLAVALDSAWDTAAHERLLMVAPYAFVVHIYELWVPLLHGSHLVLAPPADLDIATLRRLIRDEAITSVHLTAGLFRVVADEAPDCLATVREVLTGGDVISPTAVQKVLAACPGITVRAMYGTSEVSSFATTATMTAPFLPGPTVPVGHAMDGVRLYLLDERLRPLTVGEVGTLYIGGERLGRGYFGRADLTSEKFIADPFADSGQRMYRTGDQARWTPRGMIDFVGRANDQVKIRGFRVELAEVESALASFPGVTEAIAVTKPDELGENRIVGYVVTGDGQAGGPGASQPLDASKLRTHAAGLLPDYMVPSAFVELDTIPLTPNGKLDRRSLPEPEFTDATYASPASERQAILCGLFAKALGITRVGANDSFFDLGGQSLSAIRLISSINSALDVELTLDQLFDSPTVADLEKHFENVGG